MDGEICCHEADRHEEYGDFSQKYSYAGQPLDRLGFFQCDKVEILTTSSDPVPFIRALSAPTKKTSDSFSSRHS